MDVITPWEKKRKKAELEREKEREGKYKRIRKIKVPKVNGRAALLNQQQQMLYKEPVIDWSRKLGNSPRKLSPLEKQFHFDDKPFNADGSEFGDEIERFLKAGGVIKRQPNEVPIDPFDYLNGIDVDAGDLCI